MRKQFGHIILLKALPSLTVTLLTVLLLMLVTNGRLNAQVIYATGQSSTTYSCNALGCGSNTGITTPGNAVSASLSDSAIIRSGKSVLGLTAGGNASLTLKYANEIPVNGTTYIKIGTPVVTGLVTGLLGILGLVNSNIYVDAYHLGVVSTSSSNNVTMVNNGAGELFIKMAPPVSYDSIRIRVEAPVLELISTLALPVYYAKYDTTTTTCSEQALYTNLGATTGGVSLNLATAVTNPPFAIDNNTTTTASVITTGTVALGASASQTIFFNGLSASTDEVRALISVPVSLLSLGLFSNIQVQTFNGSTATSAVQSVSSALVGLDLLGLFASTAIIPVYFKSTAAFDRVVVSVSQVVSVALPSSVNVYDVRRVPGKPTFTLPVNDTVYTCSGSTALLAVDPALSGNVLRWYASSALTDVTVINSGNTYTTPALTAITTYWIANKKTACVTESERVPVRVLINPLPTITLGGNPLICQAATVAPLSFSATTNAPATYSVTWPSGPANIVNAAFTTSPIIIPVSSGLALGLYPGVLTVRNANGCVSTGHNISVSVQAIPHAAPVVTSYQ